MKIKDANYLKDKLDRSLDSLKRAKITLDLAKDSMSFGPFGIDYFGEMDENEKKEVKSYFDERISNIEKSINEVKSIIDNIEKEIDKMNVKF